MKKILIGILVVLSSLLYGQNESYELIVRVNGIKNIEGKVLIALFDSEEGFLNKRMGEGAKPADSTSLTFTFKGLKVGTYAVSIFHDLDENKELNSNFMGIPIEPYAFSNNAKGLFGPPKFEECKFEILDANKIITISL